MARVWHEVLRKKRVSRARGSCTRSHTGGAASFPALKELLGGGPGYLESHRQDSAFLEKQRRCRYLQEKLRHIKRQIQDYDRGGTVYF